RPQTRLNVFSQGLGRFLLGSPTLPAEARRRACSSHTELRLQARYRVCWLSRAGSWPVSEGDNEFVVEACAGFSALLVGAERDQRIEGGGGPRGDARGPRRDGE